MIDRGKSAIRGELLAWRKTLEDAWLTSASLAIAQRLLALEAYRTASTVCLFAALAQEVRLDRVLQNCRQSGRRILLPAYQPEQKIYGFKQWAGDQPLRVGHHGIPEPDTETFETLVGTVLMVVPGLAFDLAGGRIGYGKGYYDRLLGMECRDGGLTSVGVCFDVQVCPELKQDPWDRPVDWVVTEQRTIRCVRME